MTGTVLSFRWKVLCLNFYCSKQNRLDLFNIQFVIKYCLIKLSYLGLRASRNLVGRKSDTTTGFYVFEDESEIKNFLLEAGFSSELVNVRREGEGCAIVRAEKQK